MCLVRELMTAICQLYFGCYYAARFNLGVQMQEQSQPRTSTGIPKRDKIMEPSKGAPLLWQAYIF
jgi:hypothetical protein